jgi:hypothetical protein
MHENLKSHVKKVWQNWQKKLFSYFRKVKLGIMPNPTSATLFTVTSWPRSVGTLHTQHTGPNTPAYWGEAESFSVENVERGRKVKAWLKERGDSTCAMESVQWTQAFCTILVDMHKLFVFWKNYWTEHGQEIEVI